MPIPDMGSSEPSNPWLTRITLLYLDRKSVKYAEMQSCGARCVMLLVISTSLRPSERADGLKLGYAAAVISVLVREVKLEFATYMCGALTENVE
jgi:hypothetical protein